MGIFSGREHKLFRSWFVTDKDMDDGGPGSGNWGHAGRPGKRGGSSKGTGSAQFRSGSKETGYSRNEEARSMRKNGLKQIQGPKSNRTGTTREKVAMTFSDPESKQAYKTAKQDLEAAVKDPKQTNSSLYDKLDQLTKTALKTDQAQAAFTKNTNGYSYLVNTPQVWRSRLSDNENEALEKLEMLAEEEKSTDEQDRLAMLLSAKALGADVGEINIPDDLLPGGEKNIQSPGQLSMFIGENVGPNGSSSNEKGRAPGSKWSRETLEAAEREKPKNDLIEFVNKHAQTHPDWSFQEAKNVFSIPNASNFVQAYNQYLKENPDVEKELERLWDERSKSKKKSTKQQMQELNAKIDQAAERRHAAKKARERYYPAGNEFFDRMTGEKVPRKKIEKLAKELEEAEREFNRLVEAAPQPTSRVQPVSNDPRETLPF